MLCGLTTKSVEELAALAKSWLRSAAISLKTAGYKTEGFDPSQRAYVIAAPGIPPSALRLTVDATADSPILNPAFVIQGWGETRVDLELDGRRVARGATFRYGYDRKLERTDLIVWIQATSTSPMTVALTPTSDKDAE